MECCFCWSHVGKRMGETCRQECNQIGGNFMFHAIDTNPTPNDQQEDYTTASCPMLCLFNETLLDTPPFGRKHSAVLSSFFLHELHNAIHRWTYIMYLPVSKGRWEGEKFEDCCNLEPKWQQVQMMMVNRPTCYLSYLAYTLFKQHNIHIPLCNITHML